MQIPLDLYVKAIEKWGIKPQMMMAIEEMSELIKEITKWFRYEGRVDRQNIIQEVADVRIMLEQIECALGIEIHVQVAREQKLERLKERLNNPSLTGGRKENHGK